MKKKTPCFTGLYSSHIVHWFRQIQRYLNHQSEPTATCAASLEAYHGHVVAEARTSSHQVSSSEAAKNIEG